MLSGVGLKLLSSYMYIVPCEASGISYASRNVLVALGTICEIHVASLFLETKVGSHDTKPGHIGSFMLIIV